MEPVSHMLFAAIVVCPIAPSLLFATASTELAVGDVGIPSNLSAGDD